MSRKRIRFLLRAIGYISERNRRMEKYGTGYLVILDQLAAFPPVARDMVLRFPDIFRLEFEARAKGPGPAASVYSVDLAALTSAFADTDEGEALY